MKRTTILLISSVAIIVLVFAFVPTRFDTAQSATSPQAKTQPDNEPMPSARRRTSRRQPPQVEDSETGELENDDPNFRMQGEYQSRGQRSSPSGNIAVKLNDNAILIRKVSKIKIDGTVPTWTSLGPTWTH